MEGRGEVDGSDDDARGGIDGGGGGETGEGGVADAGEDEGRSKQYCPLNLSMREMVM